METPTSWNRQQIVAVSLSLGERILKSGGEVSRVEDTVCRFLKAYGATRVDAFTITSSIMVTAIFPNNEIITQTRRIGGQSFNMEALRALNALSRRVCLRPVSPPAVLEEIEAIDRQPQYSLPFIMFCWALASACFTVFFGGTWVDALWSAGIGILLKGLDTLFARVRLNGYFSVILCSLVGGLLANLAPLAGLPAHPSFISMGNIMPLIPGVALTNSLRDMFSGDTLTGLLRCSEAIILSLVIACGFALSSTGAEVVTSILPTVYLVTSFLGSLAFTFVFNLRGKDCSLAALGSALAWGAVLLLQALGLGVFSSHFFAGIFITLWAESFARLRRCPVTVYLVIGVIGMVPGGSLYRTMRYALSASWHLFAYQGLSTLMVAVGIAGGIMAVTSLTNAWGALRRAKSSAL